MPTGGPPAAVARGLHVYPDFLGNRSPETDPTPRGIVSGLPLSAGADDLAWLHLAAVQGIAYGTREILEALAARGYAPDTLIATGGDARNEVFLREHADATGCRLALRRSRKRCCWAPRCWARWPPASIRACRKRWRR